jgi:hypothetical protein
MKLDFIPFSDLGGSIDVYWCLHLPGSRREASRSDDSALVAPPLEYVQGRTDRTGPTVNTFANPARTVAA